MKIKFQCLLLALILFVGANWVIAQVAFMPASNYLVGPSPFSVVTADVNGDGKIDLISLNGHNSTLSVLTNNGNGVFGSNATVIADSRTQSVAAADVNGDGKMDLVCANQGQQFSPNFPSSVTVFTNDGYGGFLLSSTLNAGSRPYSVAIADINADGKMDIVCANAQSTGGNNVTILTNNGVGGFTFSSSIGVGADPLSVVVADVNKDGWMDLITANWSGKTLSVITNDGSGGFLLASSPVVDGNPLSLVAVDVNGDGWVDLVCANSLTNTLSILTNNCSGSFVLASTVTVGTGPSGLSASDVNGDGKIDLVSANFNSNTLSVVTNTGNGGFMLALTCAVAFVPYGVTTCDVNGDGLVDLVVGNNNGNTVAIFISIPSLVINPSRNTVSWSASLADWILQQNANLAADNWINFTGPISDDGLTKSATNSSPTENLFLRLKHP